MMLARASIVLATVVMGCDCGTTPSDPGDSGADAVDGSERDSSVADGTVADGPLADGPLADGPLRDAPVADIATDASGCVFDDSLDFAPPEVGDCVGRIAERTFRRAICSCSRVNLNGAEGNGVFSFDSRLGAYMPDTGAAGGSVAANGDITLSAGSVIEGTVTTPGIVQANASTIRGDVIAGTAVRSGTHGRDVYCGGDVTSATVTNDLIQTAGTSAMSTTVGGVRIECDVRVAAPCPCGEDDRIDVASFVTDAATDNDNATLGFDSAVFEEPGPIVLPPGRLYVSGVVDVEGDVRVTGDTEIYIDGDFRMNASDIGFDVDADASLDLFVTRSFTINGVNDRFGNATRPANARVYIGSTFTLNGLDHTVSANIYAPESTAALNGNGNDLFGAIFADGVTLNGDSSVFYDSSISEASDGCPDEDPMGCTRCAGCDGVEACVDGMCTECRTDADCCQPLACRDGRCVPLLI